MRHPPPGPPIRPPQRLMPGLLDGGVFFGGRDFTRRQQPAPIPVQQSSYPPQKSLVPPAAPPQQWQNSPNYRGGPMPLIRSSAPWHPHSNVYHSGTPTPPPLLHSHHSGFNPNVQTPITYVPPHPSPYELMRLANSDPIPFLEPQEEEEEQQQQHSRQHSSVNNSNKDESVLSNSSPSKTNKHRRQKQQLENSRNMISYQDLDRPEEQRDPAFYNRLIPKSGKANSSPSDKTNNHYTMKTSTDNDQALKLELDRIKKAGAQEREKLKAQRQAVAEKEAQMKKNSGIKTGEQDKREDGELGDSSDDENSKSTSSSEPKRSKKISDNLISQTKKSTGSSQQSTTPPSENLDLSVMELTRPLKLFHLDDEKNNAYREYLTTNFGRVRVHCYKPQPNFFSNLSCLEEIKRRLRSSLNPSSSHFFRHLVDENDQEVAVLTSVNAEPEDGEIESDDENIHREMNGKVLRNKGLHQLSDDDADKHRRKRSKLAEDGTSELSKSSLSEKPWMTSELRQLIKQRNKLQAQILNGDKSAEIEKKFKKIRNKISKHAKTLKTKYENSISGLNEPSLAPPSPSSLSTSFSQSQSSAAAAAAAAAAANHPLSTILDPSLVMAMLVNPSLYSHVQQQVLSNPNFMQAYQHMFAEGVGSISGSKSNASQPSKATSETQVVPSANTASSAALNELIKQVIISKSSKEQQTNQQTTTATRSRPVLTQATKPIQLSSLESDADNQSRSKSNNLNKSRFTLSESASNESQQQEIALTQELIRRQLALQQQQRNQRNPSAINPLSLSTPLSRHIPLTDEQMQEVLTRAKNYVTRQQTDETTEPNSNQPRLSYNTRRLQAALAASASSATPPTAHAIGQAAAAAIAAVTARPSQSTSTVGSSTSTPSSSTQLPSPVMNRPSSSSNLVGTPSNTSVTNAPQQHPIRIQLDQKSKTLSSISNNHPVPIPTINQQKIMPLIDVNPSPPPHMYSNAPNWQRPPHHAGPHYSMALPPQQQHYPPYDNPHQPPFYGPRMNYPPDMRAPSAYGPGPLPPRHLSQPPRFNGPVPPQGPYSYGHPPPPPQNYGPGAPPHHPHYGHPYPPT